MKLFFLYFQILTIALFAAGCGGKGSDSVLPQKMEGYFFLYRDEPLQILTKTGKLKPVRPGIVEVRIAGREILLTDGAKNRFLFFLPLEELKKADLKKGSFEISANEIEKDLSIKAEIKEAVTERKTVMKTQGCFLRTEAYTYEDCRYDATSGTSQCSLQNAWRNIHGNLSIETEVVKIHKQIDAYFRSADSAEEIAKLELYGPLETKENFIRVARECH